MFKMKRFLHLMLAVVMLLSCFQIPGAYAADEPTTVTSCWKRAACSWCALRMKRIPTATL